MGGFFLIHRDGITRDGGLVAKLHAPYERRGFDPAGRQQKGEAPEASGGPHPRRVSRFS
jgi:hypothetical protein